MCRMPESRKAVFVSSEMPPRSPVISALAMAPVCVGQHGGDALSDGVAQALDRDAEPHVPGRFAHGRVRLGRGPCVAHAADPLEPGLPAEVVAARQRRSRRRHHRRPQAHAVPGLETRQRLARRDAHAHRPRVLRHVADRGHQQREALAALGPRLHELDAPPHLDGAQLPGEHRRAHPLDAQLRHGKSRGHREQSVERQHQGQARRRNGAQDERHGERTQRGGEMRLEGQREIRADADAQQHRHPEEPALLLGFQPAQKRRERKRPEHGQPPLTVAAPPCYIARLSPAYQRQSISR